MQLSIESAKDGLPIPYSLSQPAATASWGESSPLAAFLTPAQAPISPYGYGLIAFGWGWPDYLDPIDPVVSENSDRQGSYGILRRPTVHPPD